MYNKIYEELITSGKSDKDLCTLRKAADSIEIAKEKFSSVLLRIKTFHKKDINRNNISNEQITKQNYLEPNYETLEQAMKTSHANKLTDKEVSVKEDIVLLISKYM
jgi:hypothetical protein